MLGLYLAEAASISSLSLGEVVFADPEISIVHGTDRTDPDLQAAMMDTLGFSLSPFESEGS